MKIESSASPNLLRKVLALLVTAILFWLMLLFSAVLLVIIAVVGTIAWGYLWWKLRELRKRMRNVPPSELEPRVDEGEVHEGEVIRVEYSRDAK